MNSVSDTQQFSLERQIVPPGIGLDSPLEREHLYWHHMMLESTDEYRAWVDTDVPLWPCENLEDLADVWSGGGAQVQRCGRCGACEAYFSRRCPLCGIATSALQEQQAYLHARETAPWAAALVVGSARWAESEARAKAGWLERQAGGGR